MPNLKIRAICDPKYIDAEDGSLSLKFNFEEQKQVIKDLPGKPICLEHDTTKVIGRVISASFNKYDQIQVRFEIFDNNTKISKDTIEDLKNGKLKWVSLGRIIEHQILPQHIYARVLEKNPNADAIEIKNKKVTELSLVSDPAFCTYIIEIEGLGNPFNFPKLNQNQKQNNINQINSPGIIREAQKTIKTATEIISLINKNKTPFQK